MKKIYTKLQRVIILLLPIIVFSCELFEEEIAIPVARFRFTQDTYFTGDAVFPIQESTGDIDSYVWDIELPDGTLLDNLRWDEPVNNFFMTGIHRITLTVSNDAGSDSYTDTFMFNSFLGKWNRVSGCKNALGESLYYVFNNDKTGFAFVPDCNNICQPFGFSHEFEWELIGTNQMRFVFTTDATYCGQTATAPPPETAPFEWSTSGIKIYGETYTNE